MKTIIWSVMGVMAAVLLFGFIACDRAGNGPPCFGRGAGTQEEKVAHVKQWVSKRLDLNPEQQAELDRMLTAMADRHAALRGTHAGFKQDFLDELRKDKVQPEDLKQLIEVRRPAFEEMLDLAAKNLAAFHAMLTPEQREKLIADLQTHHGRCPWRGANP
jgi:Spy/CpxP family protein refolding chaperone